MSQLQAADAVAGAPDAWVCGAKVVVDDEVIPRVDLDTRILQPDSSRLRPPPDRDEHEVRVDRRAVVEVSRQRLVRVVHRLDRAARVKGEAFLLDDPPELRNDSRVDPR